MKIAIDAMGGDFAPKIVVEGAVQFAREHQIPVILVGHSDKIKSELDRHNTQGLNLSIHHASEVIGMEESPSKATKIKQDSSMMVATRLVSQGKADAVVSAGNSGAAMTSALRLFGRLPVVYRPAITSVIPTTNGYCIVADVGANAECKPEYLLQFALMAKIAAENILNITNPKIALLSIGEEKEKGNSLIKHTYPLLDSCNDLNFIGNIEGGDIPRGKADVIICDGYAGNIVLKTMEGTAEVVMRMVKSEISSSTMAKIGYLFIKPALLKFRKKIDYAEYGGAPLLGVNGVCIISHGKSSAKAIKNALKMAEMIVKKDVNKKISSEIINFSSASQHPSREPVTTST